MDLGLLYLALDNKQIDMAAAASTDAQLGEHRFTVLVDDRKAFPPYNACYVVRQNPIAPKARNRPTRSTCSPVESAMRRCAR